ncbi:MAG: GTP 3',8-cyclase MoaA, partial [Myxococcales bacterium]|nr:GTP 3',8-cyclase MoaA [Myxococcales bacterium]
TYCMPAEGWPLIERTGLLSLEELARVIRVFAGLGVERVRLTGGEPLVRRGVVDLVREIAQTPGIQQVAMTTNAHLLARHAQGLWDAGLRGLNVSLDTFDPERFATITRGGDVAKVIEGIQAAQAVGFTDIKINAVALDRLNGDDAPALVEGCWANGWLPRFIEVMPIGSLVEQRRDRLTSEQVFDRISRVHPLRWLERTNTPNGPARYAVVTEGPEAGQRVGFISPMSDHGFCSTCNRVRLTARGGFRPCLADDHEVSLLQAIRDGATDESLAGLIRQGLAGKLEAHHLRTPTRAPVSTMTGIGG